MKKEEKIKTPTDEEVNEMIKTWDLVKCQVCGKKISMLNAKMISEDGKFVCKEHL